MDDLDLDLSGDLILDVSGDLFSDLSDDNDVPDKPSPTPPFSIPHIPPIPLNSLVSPLAAVPAIPRPSWDIDLPKSKGRPAPISSYAPPPKSREILELPSGTKVYKTNGRVLDIQTSQYVESRRPLILTADLGDKYTSANWPIQKFNCRGPVPPTPPRPATPPTPMPSDEEEEDEDEEDQDPVTSPSTKPCHVRVEQLPTAQPGLRYEIQRFGHDSVTFVGNRVFVDPYPQMANKRNQIRAATKTGIQHYRDIADSVKDLPISCDICDKEFKNPKCLSSHKSKYHSAKGDTKFCASCNKDIHRSVWSLRCPKSRKQHAE